MGLLEEILIILSNLPYDAIIVASVITFIINILWFIVIFKDKHIRLLGRPYFQNKSISTFISVYVVHFFLAYFIAILTLVSSPAMFLLIIDAFIALCIFSTLSNMLTNDTMTGDRFRIFLLYSLYFILIGLVILNIFILFDII